MFENHKDLIYSSFKLARLAQALGLPQLFPTQPSVHSFLSASKLSPCVLPSITISPGLSPHLHLLPCLLLILQRIESWALRFLLFPELEAWVLRISGEICQCWFCSVFCGVWLLCMRPRPLKQKCSPHRGHLPSLNISSSLSPKKVLSQEECLNYLNIWN